MNHSPKIAVEDYRLIHRAEHRRLAVVTVFAVLVGATLAALTHVLPYAAAFYLAME